MMNDKKVHGHDNIVKRNNAVVNVDAEGYQQALKRRSREQTIDLLIDKTNRLEVTVDNINNKLTLILQALNNRSLE